uniref:Uncharacterized protein n=1 Tax=viral metagenome TaxID=1070528 RepID=A0A6M3IQ29_9ZZZZ
MADVIDEILKFDPGRASKPKKTDDRIDEVLKFDPGRINAPAQKIQEARPVGGTFAPTGEMSTITAKPIPKYEPMGEEGAGFGTQVLSGLVDDPYIKAKIFSEARGIPITRYRVGKSGEVEFKNNQGQWQREVSQMPMSRLKRLAAETIGHPSTIAAPAGAMIAGPAGAVAGAAGGELIRKGIGKYVYGEKPGILNTLADTAMQGVFALAGEGVGKIIGRTTNRILGRKAGALKKAGREVADSLLTPEEHAKALYVRKLAEQHNIELAPHQMYDREGMTNTWKYLRKHPVTSDAVRGFEDNLAKSTDEAVDNFIRQMGGYEEGPLAVGKQIKEAASHRIGQEEEIRRAVAGPKYEAAFAEKEGEKVVTSEAIGEINRLLKEAPAKSPSGKVLLKIRGMINEAKGDPRQLHRIKYGEIDAILNQEKASPTLRREMTLVKEKLVSSLEHQIPGYEEAAQTFKELSRPIERLKKSIVGELAEIEAEKGLEIAPRKLLSIRSIRDPDRLKEAINEIARGNDPLRRRIVGSYIRDVYENLRMSEEGRVINVGGKMYKALFGRPQERELMKAAMTSTEFKQFENLMTVLQRTSVGVKAESMTAANLQIQAQLEGQMGSKAFKLVEHPKQTIVGWTLGKWDETIRSRDYPKLFQALIDPGAVAKLAKLRQLAPGSRRLIEGLAVFTAEIAAQSQEEMQRE